MAAVPRSASVKANLQLLSQRGDRQKRRDDGPVIDWLVQHPHCRRAGLKAAGLPRQISWLMDRSAKNLRKQPSPREDRRNTYNLTHPAGAPQIVCGASGEALGSSLRAECGTAHAGASAIAGVAASPPSWRAWAALYASR